jgi:hypothetical protein
MSRSQWYGDESKREDYLMVFVLVAPARVARVRAALRRYQVQGTRRMHFQTEGDQVRKRFLAGIAQLQAEHDLRVRVYAAAEGRDIDRRRVILERVVLDALEMDASWLVLERDDSLVGHDRRVIRPLRAKAGAADSLRFDHLRAVDEPMLWIPDAIAWAWCRDRAWRALVDPMITEVIRL